MAPSVGLPKTILPFDQLAVELRAPTTFIMASSRTSLSTTAMVFCVRVPVLSVKMVSTAPMVSQACILFMRLFSFAMVFMEKAKASVTDRGNPSGTATMTTTTAPMRNCTSCNSMSHVHWNSYRPKAKSQCTRLSTTNIVTATQKAPALIFLARRSSFSSRGVLMWVSSDA